jgi:hypothetical protein
LLSLVKLEQSLLEVLLQLHNIILEFLPILGHLSVISYFVIKGVAPRLQLYNPF